MVWLATAIAASLLIFVNSSASMVIASHDSVLHPTLDGEVVLRTGPVLPDFRIASGHVIGVDIELGKTTASTPEELFRRYGVIASSPDGQIAKVTEVVQDLLVDAVVRGAVIGLLPIGAWLFVGRRRRGDLWRAVRTRRGVIIVVTVAAMGIVLWEPWGVPDPTTDQARDWKPLSTLLGPDIPVPDEVSQVEVRLDVTSGPTKRLVATAVSTYEQSLRFYKTAAEGAAELDLREPREGDTVVEFVSDRHDNIGMDKVARAIGDRAGATVVFDGGDDTSNGAPWEAFSLDSVTQAFRGYDKYGVTGNHDNGSFVFDYLADRDWTMLDGHVIDGPAGTTMLGTSDPRSSGFGDWRDQHGLPFDEVEHNLADTACAEKDRVTTVLVHDANLGREILDRGCAELVLAGHLHVRVGPTRVTADNGLTGWSYTTGTTGGAVYAMAAGAKPRRDASVTLVTYRDGHPVGLQFVVLQTNGHYIAEHYEQLNTPGTAQLDQK